MIKKIVKKVVTKRVTRPAGSQRVSLATQGAQNNNSDLVIVEDSTLKMMIADPRFVAAVPCLASGKASMESVGKKCGRCSRKRNKLTREAFTQLRSCVAGLQGSNRETLKKLLGAKKVRVITGGGKRHITF